MFLFRLTPYVSYSYTANCAQYTLARSSDRDPDTQISTRVLTPPTATCRLQPIDRSM